MASSPSGLGSFTRRLSIHSRAKSRCIDLFTIAVTPMQASAPRLASAMSSCASQTFSSSQPDRSVGESASAIYGMAKSPGGSSLHRLRDIQVPGVADKWDPGRPQRLVRAR